MTECRTDGTSAFNTRTVQRRLLLLDPARGKERLRKKAPAVAQRRGDGGEAVLRQGFAKHLAEEERCWGGEGLRLGDVSPCVRYLISWIAKTFDYINRVS